MCLPIFNSLVEKFLLQIHLLLHAPQDYHTQEAIVDEVAVDNWIMDDLRDPTTHPTLMMWYLSIR